MRARRVALLMVFLSITGLVTAGQSGTAGAAPTTVDFTIRETLPPGNGTLVAGSVPGCSNLDVFNESGSATFAGPVSVFEGTKRFQCDEGDFTIRYRAIVIGCAATDSGVWRVIGGTGDFAGSRGGGLLEGTYDTGDACTATGIDDRYQGILNLP